MIQKICFCVLLWGQKVCKVLKKDGDQLSAPEQLVKDGNETSGNTALGGEGDPSIHVGSEIAPIELIEFDNNLVGVDKFPKGELAKRMF